MTETPTEPKPPETPPEPAPPDTDDDAYIAGLDDRARRLIERSNTEAARFRHELRSTEEQFEALKRKHESEDEKRVREIEERVRAENKAEVDKVTADYERRLATQAIKTKAAGRFNDANDAVAALREAGTLDALLATDGQKRDQAVDKALADLLEAKPYLGRNGDRRPTMTPGGRSDQPNSRPRERSWLR